MLNKKTLCNKTFPNISHKSSSIIYAMKTKQKKNEYTNGNY